MSEKFPDTESWKTRLPGHPQGAKAPAWQSPEGLFQYIQANVPGISPQAAQWMHAQILGGHGVTNNTIEGQLAGLTPAQMMQINSLTPFAAGASSVQPNVPGGAHYLSNAGPLVPGTPGQPGWVGPGATTAPPPPPPVNPILPPDPGPGGYPNPPTYGEIGITAPPAVPMPGYNTPDPRGGRDPYNDPDFRVYGPAAGVGAHPGAGGTPYPAYANPASSVSIVGNHPNDIGAGAHLAELSIGQRRLPRYRAAAPHPGRAFRYV